MTTVTIEEFEAGVARYIALARAGEEVVVTERGAAVARLSPPREIEEQLPERTGAVARGTKDLPDEWWDLPLAEDPEGLVVGAVHEERERERRGHLA